MYLNPYLCALAMTSHLTGLTVVCSHCPGPLCFLHTGELNRGVIETSIPASLSFLRVALISVLPLKWDIVFLLTILSGGWGVWRGVQFQRLPFDLPHCDSSYHINQRPNVGAFPTAKYVSPSYTFRDWGSDHQVGPWTQWNHCKVDFSQNSILTWLTSHP